VREGGVSFELAEAWKLPAPSAIFAGTRAERQVLSWLEIHAATIIAAESKWKIDRRAIAAAIAWEALKNVLPFGIRGVGPGKVHVTTSRLPQELRDRLPPALRETLRDVEGAKPSVAEQVELRGLLPKRTEREREAILRTAPGAIDYIGAIMTAIADIADSFGHDIRCNPAILTNEYNGRDLLAWTAHLAERSDTGPLRPGNPLGIWTEQNLFYLELGVGKPSPSLCGGP
jgi:hypothetical protein